MHLQLAKLRRSCSCNIKQCRRSLNNFTNDKQYTAYRSDDVDHVDSPNTDTNLLPSGVDGDNVCKEFALRGHAETGCSTITQLQLQFDMHATMLTLESGRLDCRSTFHPYQQQIDEHQHRSQRKDIHQAVGPNSRYFHWHFAKRMIA